MAQKIVGYVLLVGLMLGALTAGNFFGQDAYPYGLTGDFAPGAVANVNAWSSSTWAGR